MIKNRQIWLPVAYACFFFITFYFLSQWLFPKILGQANFLNWDAEHYHYIKEFGYKGFRVAFFPLLPLLWKATNVNVYGIVIINVVIFLTSYYYLLRKKSTSILENILFLSIPGFIFFYLPYTEALFFAGSVFMLLGLKKNKMEQTAFGLLIAVLSRPAFAIIFPALLITEIYQPRKGKITRILTYSIVLVIGVLLVGIIQYIDTGEWFKFFSVQKGWGNEFGLPKFPLTSWSGDFIVRLDAFAFFVGVFSGIVLLLYLLKIKPLKQAFFPPEVVFSLAYLGGVTLSVLLFREGSLFSLNRFVFATPYILVVLYYWIKADFHFSKLRILGIFWIIFFFWTLFGSYVHIHTTLMYLLLTFYVSLLFALKAKQEWFKKIALFLLIALNIVFQFYFYYRFLNGLWVA